MSDERLTAVQALTRVMADVQAVRKGDRNREQGYSFRGIDAVMNAVGPALREHRVVPVPVKTESHYRDVRTSKDKPARECTVTVTYRFYGPCGDYLDAEVPGESMDSGDKGTPKAMSVAYRTCLLQLLCIPTDEQDPDGETYERAPEDAQPDPVAVLRSQVWQAAKAVGMQTREDIEADYRETVGGDITQADEDNLRAYLAGLRGRAEQPPSDETWQTPAETDDAWVEDFTRRIDLVSTISEARGLWSEIDAQVHVRKCDDDMAQTLRDLVQRRADELKGEPDGSEG